MRRLLTPFRAWRQRRQERRIAQIIEESGLFDRNYYREANPDVVLAGVDSLDHYLSHGRQEGRHPSSNFDPQFYLRANPDVVQAGVDPFIHYIVHGRAEGRQYLSARQTILASNLFDPAYYLTAYLDVALSGENPLEHFMAHGRKEGRRPSLDFDPKFYLTCNPDLHPDIDPILHYIQSGRLEGRQGSDFSLRTADLPAVRAQIEESGVFDESFYLCQCPAIRATRGDSLLHFIITGWIHYLDPSAVFSTANYRLAHPETNGNGKNTWQHLWDSRHPAGDKKNEESSPRPRRPDDAVTLERMAGIAYFHRLFFSSDSSVLPGRFAIDAIAELVCRSPMLNVERIEPDVSIVIPVYGQLQFVLSCLDSLARHQSRFSAEILIADDASPKMTETKRLQAIPWLRYHRRESNGGFIETCNDAAKLARGRFLVFLNSDTRVAEGWLDELIGSFEIFPKAGLVGSKLTNEDGTLQEAGGVFWRDGSAWNYGRGGDPNHPKYCFSRQVDYLSGASIAVPAEVWRNLNGFDTIFKPAYCEDADLAFRLRAAGYEVWFQALSQVIHYEGKSHGRDLGSGVKRHQTINMRRFFERWKSALGSHRPNGMDPDREANRMQLDRILVVDAVTPTPDKDAGSFFAVWAIKALQALGYQVTFIPQHNYIYDGEYTRSLQRLGIECIYFPFFHCITNVLDFRSDFDVVLVHRFNVLGPIYGELRQRMPFARIIFHLADLHFLREEREAALYNSRSKKISAALTRATELELIAKVDCTSVHSSAESQVIKSYLPLENIVEFPWIAEVLGTRIPFEDRWDVMFLGGFNHQPNVDAVRHFVNQIWPLLTERLPPQARFVVVGPSAPPAIQALAGPRILIIGYAQDLRPYFDSARVFVAPLRYGAGIKGKVIQSLCYGTPSVISPIAAEGIGLISGRQTIIADDDDEFAQAVVEVYSNQGLWCKLQTAGYEYVEHNFSWERSLKLVRQLLDTADETWLMRHERRLRDRLTDLISHDRPFKVSAGK